MKLQEGILFDKRYRLVRNLGEGASAKVWLAIDTMANNLKVAVKVLSEISGIDTLGIQNFQKEFTYVYNIQHQNLLTPTNYAICEGTPYLVLPYCENGSCGSMVGRADETDVIKFLHDVSAALECLHAHNIVHQDIKPDNILLDDDCNFLVTDFGISTHSAGSPSPQSDSYGGTREYMGPERFEKGAVPINMNDIWSLGATAFEMATGNAPFGDNGGMVQAMGESIPDLPDTLQPEVRKLIISCLDSEPWKRPSAEEIRKKTQLYLETGSWNPHNPKKYVYIGAAALAALLLIIGLLFFDYNRNKVYYYKDYVEYWGIPKGIGRLTGSEMHHRERSYRMEYRQHKLRRLSLVNPEGNLIPHSDTENMISRYIDVRYYYTDDGKIDYKTIYDQAGKLLFKMDYDDALKTVTFRQNDEYGTEMNLRANTTDLQNQGSQLFEDKSRISRYLLTHDKKGLLTTLRYVGLQNVPAGDAENIYGISYKYDKKGHKIEEQFLGADGNPTSNKIGLSIKQFKYDDDDNWCEVRYLNIEKGPSHDGNNCPLVKIQSDKWGNRIAETYHTLDGSPSVRKDFGVSGFSYEYDNKGHNINRICLGIDNNPIPCRYGFTKIKMEYDDRGYVCQLTNYDANDNPACDTQDGNSIGMTKLVNNDKGLVLESSFFDEEGKPMETIDGCHKWVNSYDSIGNKLTLMSYDMQGNPADLGGQYAKTSLEYDEFNRLIAIHYQNAKGTPAADADGVSTIKAEYNRQGGLVKISFFDTSNKPTLGSAYFASRTWDYDELGNEKNTQFYDTEGNLTNSSDGIARSEYIYDSKTNFLITTNNYNEKGSLVSSYHQSYDKRGNVVKEYTVLSSGQLKQGTAVEHTEYDSNNHPIVCWWSNLKDQPTNCPGMKYAKIKNKFDGRGNIIEQVFLSTTDKPSVDEQGTYKRIRKYNDLGLEIYERNLDAEGKPLIGRNVNPEGKVEYDKQGNMTKLECYDGYGKPRLSADGYFQLKIKYNKQNKVLEVAYYGLDGNLVKSKENDFARKTLEYNQKGLEIEDHYYNEKDRLFRIDTYKYNDKNRMTEQLIQNDKKQPNDDFWGFSKCVIIYNQSGLIPTQRNFYNKKGTRVAYQPYNNRTKEWGQIVVSNPQQPNINVAGNQWRQAVREFAALCPMDTGNGVQIASVYIDGDVVVCVVKMTTIGIDDLDENQRNEIRANIRLASVQMKKVMGLPSSIQMNIMVEDKNGKRI